MTGKVTAESPGELEAAVRELTGRMAGRRLPSEREMASQFGASRPRLRAVLARLQSEGLVEARHGSGTYAVAVSPQSVSRIRRASIVIDAGIKLGDDPFFSLLLERVQTACQNAGASCLLSRFPSGSDALAIPADSEGIITIGLEAGRVALRASASHRSVTAPPVVALLMPADTLPATRASVLQLDNTAAGAAAARRLIDGRECRHLIFLGRDTLPAARERLRGVEAVCLERGIPLEMHRCGLNYAAGFAAGQNVAVAANAGTTGLIAANDWLAAGLRAGLVSQGNVTAALPIASFDGLALAANPALEIESLAVPLEQIASDTWDELHRLRQIPKPASGRILRYALEPPADRETDVSSLS